MIMPRLLLVILIAWLQSCLVDNVNSKTTGSKTYATVNIIGVNQPPIAEAKVDKDEVREGEEVILNGEDSNDPSGDSLTYLWKQTDDSIEKVNILDANEAVANFKVPDKLKKTQLLRLHYL